MSRSLTAITNQNTFTYDQTRADKDYFRDWLDSRIEIADYYKETEQCVK
jgi:hypothetical protein